MTRRISVLLVLLAACFQLTAADTAPDAAADAAWAEILKTSKPPVPPAEWNKTPPTAEQIAAFKKVVAASADKIADSIKKFYDTYPNDAHVQEARTKEKAFRDRALALRGETAQPADAQAAKAKDEKADPAFKAKFEAAMEKVKGLRSQGPAAVGAELEKSGRELSKEFPQQSEPWEMLYFAARSAEGDKSAELYKMVAKGAPDPRLRAAAEQEIKPLEQLGKPLQLKYTAVDGRQIDVSRMTGKVVLIDFWATWCGPCVAEVPNVKKTYDELHPQGFEIVGVSFDNDCDDLKKFIKKKDMTWAQFCDGGGWNNAVNKDFGIHAIPAMYLVDKKGILRDLNARDDLAEKVRKLLKE